MKQVPHEDRKYNEERDMNAKAEACSNHIIIIQPPLLPSILNVGKEVKAKIHARNTETITEIPKCRTMHRPFEDMRNADPKDAETKICSSRPMKIEDIRKNPTYSDARSHTIILRPTNQ